MDTYSSPYWHYAVDIVITFREGFDISRIGQATAHGAISVLNALTTGKGSTISIELSTKAIVTLENGPGPVMCYNSNTYGSENLASLTVRKTLEHYGYGKKYHGEVETSSNIPNSVGLKSSSAATNSIALATVSALGEKPLDMDVLKIGMEATVESGLSLTGAFDDAYASYFGGGVVADNEKKIVEKILELPGNLQIFVLVPTERSVRVPLDPSKNSAIRTISELAYSQVRKGKIWDALTLNGLAFSSILGNDQRPSLYAIQAGAYGAGLSGKGPAIAAVTNTANAEKVRETLASFGGQLIETRPNFTKAAIEP